MKYCYNIYPMGNASFSEVFAEIVEPAAKACGYEIYRLDRHSSDSFVVDTAEKLITACDVCIADISTDNPNIWYEIGYAYSAGKKVILLCSDVRDTSCPLSVIGRHIIKYSTKTLTDAGTLRANLQMRLSDSETTDKSTPLIGLDIEVLTFINNLQNTPHEAVPKEKITASKTDVQAALKRLVDRKYVEYIYSVNASEQQSSYYRVTQKGLDALDNYLNDPSSESVPKNAAVQTGDNSIQIGQVAAGGTVNVMMPK